MYVSVPAARSRGHGLGLLFLIVQIKLTGTSDELALFLSGSVRRPREGCAEAAAPPATDKPAVHPRPLPASRPPHVPLDKDAARALSLFRHCRASRVCQPHHQHLHHRLGKVTIKNRRPSP